MLLETRKQELMKRLKLEREERLRKVQEGDSTIVYDQSLIQTPSIGGNMSCVSEPDSLANSEQKLANSEQKLAESVAKISEIRKKLSEQKARPQNLNFDRLAQPKTEVQQYRQLIKDKEIEEEINSYPFKPNISDYSNLIATIKNTRFEGMSVQERLSILEKERQDHIEDLRLAQLEEEEPELKIPKPYMSADPPIYKRYQQVQQEKQALLECLRIDQLKSESGLFVPQINPKSQMLAEIQNDGKNVIQRLLEDAKNRQLNAPQIQESLYDFQPETNKQLNDQVVKGDFDSRQQLFLRKQQEKCQELENKVYEDYSFKPQISNYSQKLINKDTTLTVHEKLYQEYLTKQQNIEYKRQKELERLNFHPELNPKSMALTVDRKIDDLINDESSKLKKQLLREKYSEDEIKNCSFYPSLSTTTGKYSQIHSQYSFDDCSEKIKEQQDMKKQKMQNAKKEIESQELKECTFKPQTNKKAVINPQSEVNGMEEYLLQVDRSRRFKEQQKQVERKLFQIHDRYDSAKHTDKTQFSPFKLKKLLQQMIMIQIQADYQLIKIGINTSYDKLPYDKIQLHERVVYSFKLAPNKFQEFLLGQFKQILKILQEFEPIRQEVRICGYGTSENEEFDFYCHLFEDEFKLKLVKCRGVLQSINAIDRIMNKQESWFFRFKNIVSIVDLNKIRIGQIDQTIVELPHATYPYLYVNINKSVSFYKVNAVDDYTKLNGSLITDTTLENLLRLLDLKGDINEHFSQAFIEGDNNHIDLTVEDIYGNNYQQLNLPKDIIASSMGKLQTKIPQNLNKFDIIKSFWFMFAINLGQLSSLNAQIEDLKTVIFGSSKIIIDPFLYTLQVTTSFFGQGKLEINFIKNSEYLTCLY
ncbi:hypothetical protein pb186bvf_011168 [Paramecium bursaria]